MKRLEGICQAVAGAFGNSSSSSGPVSKSLRMERELDQRSQRGAQTEAAGRHPSPPRAPPRPGQGDADEEPTKDEFIRQVSESWERQASKEFGRQRSTASQANYYKPEQTIILFDWDDTLCPSTWIKKNRPTLSFFRPPPDEDRWQRPLRELEARGIETLELAMTMGKVIIVTNAVEPWVENSCRNFLPALLPLVSKLPIIYARSIYDQVGDISTRPSCQAAAGKGTWGAKAMPGMFGADGRDKLAALHGKLAAQNIDAPQRWKEAAFEQSIGSFYSRYQHQSWKNIISIGDSVFERDAVRRVVGNRPESGPNATKKCRTKTVKLIDEPKIEELIAEVRIVTESLGIIVQHDGNLDIEVDKADLQVDLSLVQKVFDSDASRPVNYCV